MSTFPDVPQKILPVIEPLLYKIREILIDIKPGIKQPNDSFFLQPLHTDNNASKFITACFNLHIGHNEFVQEVR